MILEEGDVITLDANGKDYLVIKTIEYNNENYYYMMTVKKPVEISIIKLAKNEQGQEIIVTVTDQHELEKIMKLTAKKNI